MFPDVPPKSPERASVREINEQGRIPVEALDHLALLVALKREVEKLVKTGESVFLAQRAVNKEIGRLAREYKVSLNTAFQCRLAIEAGLIFAERNK